MILHEKFQILCSSTLLQTLLSLNIVNENFKIINKPQHCYFNCSNAVFSKYFVNLTQPYGLTSIGQKYIMELT